MSAPIVSAEQLETVIRRLPDAFTILDYSDAFRQESPYQWNKLVDRYGLYGSGTGYSALTYLSNRLSAYSRRKKPGLLEPTPVGWNPEEGRYLRRSSREERQRFGSPWIVVYRRRGSEANTGAVRRAASGEGSRE